MTTSTTASVLRGIGQAALGAVLLTTGTAHLTVARKDFQAQVPDWFPADKDKVVLASGVAELAIGTALLTTWRQPARGLLGAAVSAFFVAIFPGNIAQYTEHKDGFGLDTDRKRALRLLGQPVLVAWAWAATRG
jgi:uncharacterized membrane protein